MKLIYLIFFKFVFTQTEIKNNQKTLVYGDDALNESKPLFENFFKFDSSTFDNLKKSVVEKIEILSNFIQNVKANHTENTLDIEIPIQLQNENDRLLINIPKKPKEFLKSLSANSSSPILSVVNNAPDSISSSTNQTSSSSRNPTPSNSRNPTPSNSRNPNSGSSRNPNSGSSRNPTPSGSRNPTSSGSRNPTSSGFRNPTLSNPSSLNQSNSAAEFITLKQNEAINKINASSNTNKQFQPKISTNENKLKNLLQDLLESKKNYENRNNSTSKRDNIINDFKNVISHEELNNLIQETLNSFVDPYKKNGNLFSPIHSIFSKFFKLPKKSPNAASYKVVDTPIEGSELKDNVLLGITQKDNQLMIHEVEFNNTGDDTVKIKTPYDTLTTKYFILDIPEKQNNRNLQQNHIMRINQEGSQLPYFRIGNKNLYFTNLKKN